MALGFGSSMFLPQSNGLRLPQKRVQQQAGQTNDPLTTQYNLYNTAVQQQAGDYGNIMNAYKNLLSGGASSDVRAATKNLGDLATTGGLSDADIANIRARGVSPIRAAYSAAMRNVDRQRGLQGGYSPNYAAVQAKLAREQSEQLAQGSTNVEAEIAKLRQQGRLAAAPEYSSAASRQSEIPLRAAEGMTSLYGTTPALAQLFGNQALQGAQFQNQINQQGQEGKLQLIGQLMGRL